MARIIGDIIGIIMLILLVTAVIGLPIFLWNLWQAAGRVGDRYRESTDAVIEMNERERRREGR